LARVHLGEAACGAHLEQRAGELTHVDDVRQSYDLILVVPRQVWEEQPALSAWVQHILRAWLHIDQSPFAAQGAPTPGGLPTQHDQLLDQGIDDRPLLCRPAA
jgi:hypothetical protein